MEQVYIVFINQILGSKETTTHGAFRSHRDASQWLANEGFEAGMDDELSELYEEETLSFTKSENGLLTEKAVIETFALQTIESID